MAVTTEQMLSPRCRILQAARPVALAHRGCAADWPENTRLAFENCQRGGDVVIETDLRVTKDGQLVLVHDERLDRTTDGHGNIATRSLSELQELDAGYWFTHDGVEFPQRGRGHRICTLDELVEVAPGCSYNVELKPGAAQVAERFWSWLEQRRLHERFLVASADHGTLSTFRRLSAGRVATSASRREVLIFLAALVAGRASALRVRYQALQLPSELARRPLIDERLLQAARSLGVALHVWTINTRAELEPLLELGVDGVMTDECELLGAILGAANRVDRRGDVESSPHA
jgi:glycerophosphoryl diester phosphodiesterase